MSDESEENYAAAVGRSMWRMAKRKALAAISSKSEISAITRAASSGPPENKSLRLDGSSLQDRRRVSAAPTSLREFLKRLGAELAQDDQRPTDS